MTTENISSINELESAIRSAREVWREAPEIMPAGLAARAMYERLLINFISAIPEHNLTSVQKELFAEVIVDLCQMRIVRGEALGFQHCSQTLELLNDAHTLEHCLKNPEADRVIAWICMYKAYFHQRYVQKDNSQSLHKFLTRWVGQGLFSPNFPKLVDTAALIYGGHPSMAELLEFEYSNGQIHELYVEKRPVIKKPQVDNAMQQYLPNNFSV